MSEDFVIGDRVMLELEIENPIPDYDGDIWAKEISTGLSRCISPSALKKIPVVPTPIAREDIRVGDTIRAVEHTSYDTYSQIDTYEFTVSSVDEGVIRGRHRAMYFGVAESYVFELVYPPTPEIKVGDTIKGIQAMSLPVGSLLHTINGSNPELRVVTVDGLFDPNFSGAKTLPWTFYEDSSFIVKFIEEEL